MVEVCKAGFQISSLDYYCNNRIGMAYAKINTIVESQIGNIFLSIDCNTRFVCSKNSLIEMVLLSTHICFSWEKKNNF